MTSNNPRDAIWRMLHADNYDAYARGAEAAMHGHRLPDEATGIGDLAYWVNEGWQLRAFTPLTSDKDYARITRQASSTARRKVVAA